MRLHWENGKLILRCFECRNNQFICKIEVGGEGDAVSNTLVCSKCGEEYGDGWITDMTEGLLIEEGEFHNIVKELKQFFLNDKVSKDLIIKFFKRIAETDKKFADINDFF